MSPEYRHFTTYRIGLNIKPQIIQIVIPISHSQILKFKWKNHKKSFKYAEFYKVPMDETIACYVFENT